MMISDYRTSVEQKEILRLLQNASDKGKNFVWQTFNDRRTILPIAHVEIDFVSREVAMTLEKHSEVLVPAMPLYVKLSHRESVFKVSSFKGSQSTLQFAFPQEVKTLELRKFPRQEFDPKREKTISLRPSLGSQRDNGNSMVIRVQDVSEYGLGLIMSESNRSFMKNNSILWITHLHKEELRYPVLAEVAHISSEGNRKVKEIKVGLKLSGLFPAEPYSNFIQ